MPDISNKDKDSIIRLAKCFSRILSKVSFKNGSQIYYYTFQKLYKRSARWRYCLICGRIGSPEEFLKRKHECPTVVFHNVQVLVSTSWFMLKDFFLDAGYEDVLRAVGIDKDNLIKKDDCPET